MLDKIFDRLTRGIELVLGLAFIAAVGMNFVNVVGRYGFGWTLMWGDEVQIYIMIWMAFLGAVVVGWREMHLRMDIFYKMLPRRVQWLVQLLELITLVALCGLAMVQSGHYAQQMYKLGRVSDVAQIPMWIPNGGVAVGFALLTLIGLLRLARVAMGKKLKREGAPGDVA